MTFYSTSRHHSIYHYVHQAKDKVTANFCERSLSHDNPPTLTEHHTSQAYSDKRSRCTGRMAVHFHQPCKFLAGELLVQPFPLSVKRASGKVCSQHKKAGYSCITASTSRSRSRLLLRLSKRKNDTFLRCQNVNGSLVATRCFS